MEPTRVDVASLIWQLEHIQDGGNVHIVETAVFWLRRYKEFGRDDLLQEFAALCKGAVDIGGTRQLWRSMHSFLTTPGKKV